MVEKPQHAERLARSAPQLADEKAARLLLARFDPMPLDPRPRAEATSVAAAAIARVDRGAVCRAIARRIKGILEHVDGRPRPAARNLARAAELFERADLPLEAGDVHRILIDVYLRAENDDSARRAAREANACYRRAGGADARRRGSLEMNLGNLHHRRDEHKEALSAYARARRHYATAKEPLRLAIIDYNRANVLTTIDRTREARGLYERARKVFASRRVDVFAAQTDFAMAYVDLLEGRLDPCLNRLLEVRRAMASRGDRYRVAHAELDSAEAYLRLNRPVEAESAARSADQFFRRAGQLSESASCAAMRAGAALQQGRPGQAVRLFTRGRDLQRRIANPVGAALLEIGQAQAELRTGRTEMAMATARRASRILKRAGLGSREARALAIGAEAAFEARRPALARRWAGRARDLARRKRDSRVEISALMVLSRLERESGNSTASYRYLRSAERCVERLRRGITTEESRLAFALDKSEVYEALILNRLETGGKKAVREALVFAERGKARALAERLTAGQLRALGGSNPRSRMLLERLTGLEERLALAESRLQETGSTPGLRGERMTRLDELTAERLRTLDRLSGSDASSAALVGAPPPDPERSIRKLQANELVLEYTEAGGQFHLFAIDRDRVEAFPAVAPVRQVQETIERLRFQLSKGVLGEAHADRFGRFIAATIRGYFEQLHAALLGPVRERLGGKLLRIVPHGILHGLPFHALEHDGAALIDHSVVCYSPSLATMALLSQRRRSGSAMPLVLGVPDRKAPLIEHEIEAVRRHVHGATVYRGHAATREALRLSEHRPALLHVACHGFYCEEGTWNSGLRLGDAWLSLSELYALRGTASLVVLSGCETGRGTVYSGDEWVGLVRAFLQAGARSVVASLWETHDQFTVTLMDNFYQALASGKTVAEALATAQRRARREDASPLRWAPFVVIGEPHLRLPLRKVA